jgi:hypothetical protein
MAENNQPKSASCGVPGTGCSTRDRLGGVASPKGARRRGKVDPGTAVELHMGIRGESTLSYTEHSLRILAGAHCRDSTRCISYICSRSLALSSLLLAVSLWAGLLVGDVIYSRRAVVPPWVTLEDWAAQYENYDDLWKRLLRRIRKQEYSFFQHSFRSDDLSAEEKEADQLLYNAKTDAERDYLEAYLDELWGLGGPGATEWGQALKTAFLVVSELWRG